MNLISQEHGKLKCLIKTNSVDFVEKAFQLYQDRELFLICADHESNTSNFDNIDLDIIRPIEGGGWIKTKIAPITDASPAQIILSSGTEGRPKCIVISHGALTNVVSRLNKEMKLDRSIKEYIGAPVTFSFGLGRCRAVATAGGQCFIPDGFNLVEIKSMLVRGEINAISGVPSQWRLLLQTPKYLGKLGEKVRWIEIGSQYMSGEEKIKIRAVFPNARIVQHYGLTEASRSVLLDISGTEDRMLDSVGPIQEQNVGIRLDEDNRIQIKGEHIALGEFVNGEVISLVDNDGWLTTNDVGKIADGYLYYNGRFDDIINCGGIKVDPEVLQQRINVKLADNYQVAIAGLKDELRGEVFFIAVDALEFDSDRLREIVNAEFSKMNLDTENLLEIVSVRDIPRTETGKVRRKELVRNYQSNKNRNSLKNSDIRLFDVYQDAFPNKVVTQDSTFASLNGDSLNYVQVSMEIEDLLGYLPQDWEVTPIREFSNSRSIGTKRWAMVEGGVLLRALAIIGIVVSHSGLTFFGGGTYLLFMLIGVNLARFQSKNLAQGYVWGPLRKYISRILTFYLLFMIVFFVWKMDIDLSLLFLYQNLIGIRWTIVFPFWFVQVLLQCLLLLAVLFSISPIRRFIFAHYWRSSFITLFALIGVRLIYPNFWEPLGDVTPFRFLVLIWLGWTLHLCRTTPEKCLTIVAGILYVFHDVGFQGKVVWLVLGLIAIPFLNRIPVPSPLDWVIKIISAATLYIFIFNGLPIYLLDRFLQVDSFALNFLAAMFFGMFMWIVFEKSRFLRFFDNNPK